VIMLASGNDASGKPRYRLHMASIDKEAKLKADEAASEDTLYCCCCLWYSAQQASYKYESEHSHATNIAHIGHLEKKMSRVKIESFQQSRLVADARVAASLAPKGWCKCCSKCWSWGKYCSKCWSYTSIGSKWNKSAQLTDQDMDKKRWTESVDLETSKEVSVHFPQNEKRADLTEKCAITSTIMHTIDISFHGQNPCFAVADASQPFADVVKLSSLLHGMIENEEAVKERAWGPTSSNVGSTPNMMSSSKTRFSCCQCSRLSRFQKKCIGFSALALVVVTVVVALAIYFSSQS